MFSNDHSEIKFLHLIILRAFHVAAARLWNSLPSHVTAAPSFPFSAVVFDYVSSRFLIPLSDFSLTMPAH